MVTLIPSPSIIEAAGNQPKVIREHVGRVNFGTADTSVAHMSSPAGWEEPGQTPEFDEYTLVLAGILRVATKAGEIDVVAGQAVIARKGEWVCSSSPHEGSADYIAVCVPAFSPETVNRDA